MKPKLFIASSVEARRVASQIAERLAPWYASEVWTDGFFRPGGSTADTIERRLSDFDGAIFILSPDDLIATRGVVMPAPRANVLFELGMFGGALGLPNCIQIVLKVEPAQWSETIIAGKLPHPPKKEWRAQIQVSPITDLAGITYIELKAEVEEVKGYRHFFLNEASIGNLSNHFERLRASAARLLGSTLGHPPQDLVCGWYEGEVEHRADVDACVFGDRLRASYQWSGDGKKYELSVRMEGEQLLWGHWWNPIEVSYGGYAQFQVRSRPSYLLGAWLGWSSNGGIKSGRFILAQKRVMKEAVADANSVELASLFRNILRRLPHD